MAGQFHVFPHPVAARRSLYPYIVVLQHPGFRPGPEVLAAPLAVPLRAYHSRVLPLVQIRDRPLQLMTHEMSPIAQGLLRRTTANLEADRDRSIAAIDLLFAGS